MLWKQVRHSPEPAQSVFFIDCLKSVPKSHMAIEFSRAVLGNFRDFRHPQRIGTHDVGRYIYGFLAVYVLSVYGKPLQILMPVLYPLPFHHHPKCPIIHKNILFSHFIQSQETYKSQQKSRQYGSRPCQHILPMLWDQPVYSTEPMGEPSAQIDFGQQEPQHQKHLTNILVSGQRPVTKRVKTGGKHGGIKAVQPPPLQPKGNERKSKPPGPMLSAKPAVTKSI